MALKGAFNWYNSIQQGGRRAISFTLLCDNMFQTETFDCAIIDSGAHVPPQIRRQISYSLHRLHWWIKEDPIQDINGNKARTSCRISC